MLKKLWKRTKEVATMYTGTFIVVMILNQLLFFGFCLNPVCLIAAMPHVLFITVIIGTWINKKNGWGSGAIAEKTIKKTVENASSTLPEVDRSLGNLNEELKAKVDQKKPVISSDEKVAKLDKSSVIEKSKDNYSHEGPISWSGEPPPWSGEPPPWLDESQSWITETPPWLVDEILNEDFVWGDENNDFIDKLKEYGISSIWHMTHRDNIEGIIDKGILSNNLAYQSEKPKDISNKEVQRLRERREPLYNRRIYEYTPTYFKIKNPMLYVKKDMHDELCLVEISLAVLLNSDFVFTNGNAAARNTVFYRNVSDLEKLPWDVLNASYWNDFTDGKRKRCAELLIHPLIESRYILKVHCRSFETLMHVSKFSSTAQISEELFFGSSISYPASYVENYYDNRPF